MTIQVYSSEISDGIAEKIKANTSIAYTSPILKLDDNLSLREDLIARFGKANADLKHTSIDLFPMYSLLVTAGLGNLNDDYFLPEEVWAARNTPEDKALNLNHDQLRIIGHITDNYPVDQDFKVIAQDTPIDKLPSKFHIITCSVIYRVWEDKARHTQVAQILHEIENSNPPKHFVSMETLFTGFSFMLTNELGESKIVNRDETTAALTKHLRAYGGTGKYENYKISRVLRNLTFSGHGIVGNPANVESVIFDRNTQFNFNNASLQKVVYNQVLTEINKESDMADVSLANIEKLITDLKAESTTRIQAFETQVTTLNKTVADYEAEKKALADQITKLAAELTQAKFDFDKFKKDKDEEDKKAKSASEEKEKEMKKDKDCVTAENEAMKKTLEEYKKASKKTARSEALKKTKIKAEALETTLESFANLDDATFDAVVKTFAMDDDDEEKDDSKADFGAHPVEGETPTSDSTKTQDVNQFGKTKPKNVMGDPTHADVIATASADPSLNLGVSDLEKSIAKVQTDIQKYLSKGKKVKGE